MSRALLVFDLPDEADLFDTAAHAQDWRDVVDEFDGWARNEIKYGVPETRKEQQRLVVLNEAREKLWELLKAKGLQT